MDSEILEVQGYINVNSNLCCICQWRMPYGLSVCAWCWKQYKNLLQDNPSWFREMKNESQRERRRIDREWGSISIDLIQEWETNFSGYWKHREALGQ